MPFTALITLLSLILYMVLSFNVGRARVHYQIKAPAITGSEDFERCYRVQMNTLEQMIVFLPALWLFATYMSDHIAAALGATWIIGRILYALGYYAEADRRHLGFGVSILATIALVLGALWGVGHEVFIKL
jgi:uncharacterized membrane protein YecN with MAPEG domain